MTMNEPRTQATRAWRALSFTPVFAGLLAAAIALPSAAESANPAATATARRAARSVDRGPGSAVRSSPRTASSLMVA